MSTASWTAELRIARREAWRNKLRSGLVMLLVGLPVFVLAGADVLYRTYQLSPEQSLDRTIGHADARIDWFGQPDLQQTVDPDDGGVGGSAGPSSTPLRTPTTADLAALLPAGSRLIAYRNGDSALTFFTKSGIATSSVVGLDYADPIASGMVEQLSGRAPRTDDEVAITRALSADTGLGVGDTLRTVDPARALHVVGVVLEPGDQSSRDLYQLPSALPAPVSSPQFGTDDPTWLVSSPHPITWNIVTALNKVGYVTLSRQVLRDPPPKSAQTLVLTGGSVSGHAIASATLVGGMALLEVVLLAGPAFTVGARRRRRELGLVAAVGGARHDLRRIVLADAIVLGLAAGVVWSAAGIGAAALAEPLVEHVVDALPGSFNVPWAELAGLVLVSLATALLAALVPAVRAARTDVVAALAGRRGTTRTSVRMPILGALVIAAGVVISLGAIGTASASSVLLGVLLVEVGLVVLSPALIGAVARLARWLPVSGRIALRDAGRNRASAAPAVAAVMATVIGATAAGIAAASSDAYQRRLYIASLPQRDTYVALGKHPDDLGAATAALHASFPDAPLRTVHSVANPCDPYAGDPASGCTSVTLQLPQGTTAQRWLAGDLPQAVVDDGSGVTALFGRPEPAAAAALRAGHVVVLDHAGVHRGMVTVTAQQSSGSSRSLAVPATVVGTGYAGFELILPPSVARQLDVAVEPAGVLAPQDHPLTSARRQALALSLSHTGDDLRVHAESGYHDPAGWLPFVLVGGAALIAAFAALIATALANVDSRADLVLLAAVGAAPRTRRTLSFARAAVITGIGAVIGVLAGVLPARAWVQSVGAPVVVPWGAVGTAVVGIPLLAASLAWLCTRARLPSERPA